MNERSFIVSPMANIAFIADRPRQILRAAMVCFARQGFHETTMQDISLEAGISVGLIYRYFKSKDDVISTIADKHKQQIHELLERAWQASSLLESFEVLFTAHCSADEPQVVSAFVVDLFAEASRNNRVAVLVRDVRKTALDGVTDLIARAPEAKSTNWSPRELAELIFAVMDGMLMRDVLHPAEARGQQRERQIEVARKLWRVLFNPERESAYA
jgi:AcrR family transcriptional regulator